MPAAPGRFGDFEDGSLGGSLTISAGSVIGPGSFNGSATVSAPTTALDSACGPQTSKCHDWFYGGEAPA